jgi:hypothetical protein
MLLPLPLEHLLLWMMLSLLMLSLSLEHLLLWVVLHLLLRAMHLLLRVVLHLLLRAMHLLLWVVLHLLLWAMHLLLRMVLRLLLRVMLGAMSLGHRRFRRMGHQECECKQLASMTLEESWVHCVEHGVYPDAGGQLERCSLGLGPEISYLGEVV